ncbi:MAG: PAS domain-containing protein [Solirubrobacteraceae bacterium]
MTATETPRGRTRPVPIAEERTFALDELFISTTDAKGIVRSGNRVFSRVAAYAQDEMVGTNHNLIRHPDMPRAAFRLLWDWIGAGQPVAVYVKNLAKDGRFYWVMAVVAPVDGGYVSVRMKPTSPFFALAQELYGALLAVEREVENGNVRRRKDAIAASAEKLGELLADAGYPSYEAFMHAALVAEVAAREAAMEGDRRRPGADAAQDPELAPLQEACARMHESLQSAIGLLDRVTRLGERLEQRARFAAELAADIRLFSINAQLAADRLGDRGSALQAVAGLMRARSQAANPVIERVSAGLRDATGSLGDMGFGLAAGMLQSEMLLVYLDELAADSARRHDAADDLWALAQAGEVAVDRLFRTRAAAHDALAAVAAHGEQLAAELRAIRALEVNGRIEAAHVSSSGDAAALFATIAERVDGAHDQVRDFAAALSAAGLERLGAAADGLRRAADVRARVSAAVGD